MCYNTFGSPEKRVCQYDYLYWRRFKMKKLLATVLALALLTGALFALTACGNEAAPQGEPVENSEQAAESSSGAAPIVGEWKNDTTYP